MSEWREYKLQDVAQLAKNSWKVGDEKLPYIALEHIVEKGLRLSGVGNSDTIASNKYRFNDSCFLFGKLRPYFRKLYRPNFDGICSTDIWVVKPKDNNDKDFLFYFFANQEFIDFTYSGSSGTRMPRADWKFVGQSKWDFPPLPEQKAIAEVLSSLDDKIDLLHRQNKTLEQMAETLFRQWFVEEAREDWEEYKVSDIATHIKENIKPSSNPLLVYKHYSLPAFDNGKNPVVEIGREILSNKYKVLPKTILVSKLNPIVPRIWAISENVSENSICSTEFQVFQPKKESYYGFLCFLFKSDDAVGELKMAASGTSGSHQRVKPQDILNISFTISSFRKIENYSQDVIPLIEKQQRNNDYIRTLESLRDTLLPKLMNGEVRVNHDRELK